MKFLVIISLSSTDIVENLIRWIRSSKMRSIKSASLYEKINKDVQKEYYDYWQKTKYYNYNPEIREEFRTLWREIQINKIL